MKVLTQMQQLRKKWGGVLSNVNLIQSAIMQLEGGAFQKLFDEYLYKKYKFKNIKRLEFRLALINQQRVHRTPMF